MWLQTLLQLLVDSILYISILVLITFSILIVFKTSSFVNFAQGAISSFAAFVAAIISIKWGWRFLFALPFGVLVGFVIGILIDLLLFKKTKNIKPIEKQIVTLGLLFAIAGFIPILFGNSTIEVAPFMSRVKIINLGKILINLSYHMLISFIITVIVIGVFFILLKYTKLGLGFRSTASNKDISEMMGVNTRVITSLSFGIAGGMAALAAIMYAPINPLTSMMMLPFEVNGFYATMIGGPSSFLGPVLSAVVIQLTSILLNRAFSIWTPLIIYTLILVIILIKPKGLFGKKEVKKV